MRAAAWGSLSWWQVNLMANGLVGLACLAMVSVIVGALVRRRQLRSNKLALATVVVFAGFGAQRVLQVTYQTVSLLGPNGSTFAAGQRNVWWLAVFQVAMAAVAIYYLLHRRSYGRLLLQAFLFDSFSQRQWAEAREANVVSLAGRAAAERERDTNAAMLQSVIQHSKALISVKDLEGRYLLVNESFERAFGLTNGAVLGQTDDDVNPVLAPAWRRNDLLALQGVLEVDEWSDDTAGRHFYETATFPLRTAEGTVYATCGMSLDVTERHRAVEVVARARDEAVSANAAKSTFLATMSHEIRTPMNAVIGMADLLLGTRLDAEQKEFVDTVRSSGDALMAVINDILDFSKIEAGELHLESAAFDLRDEVEICLDFVAAAATAKDLDLVCYIHQSCPERVRGDAVRMRQIIVNLLSNAVKFTHAGEVLVTVSTQAVGETGLAVSLSVADTGIGIDPEGLERLFKSFSQVDASTTRVYGGTGLGLAISQRLATAMGGPLTVASTPGSGSTFSCTLQLDACADAEPREDRTGPAGAGAAAAVLSGRSVLLVDDNATNLHILDLQLSSLGMVCATADGPAKALALVAAGLDYDIALIDMHMPQLNGLELGARLRQAAGRDRVPMVLLTSVGWRPVGFEESFAAFVTKPAKSAVLIETLVRLLDSDRTTRRPAPVPAEVTAAAVPPLRILLAEDNRVNQRVAQLMLGRLGHEVETVADGQEAVDAVLTGHYDVVLMDVQMPRLDGLEATRTIRSRHPDDQQPFIVAMTASVLVEDRDACAAAGMDAYLSKPVRVSELEAMLARATLAARALRDDQPAIDRAVFDRLLIELGDSDGALRGELTRSYLAEGSVQVRSLMVGADDGPAAVVASLAHSLRSTSALLGAAALANLLRRVEQTAGEPAAERRPLARQVEAEFGRVETALLQLAS